MFEGLKRYKNVLSNLTDPRDLIRRNPGYRLQWKQCDRGNDREGARDGGRVAEDGGEVSGKEIANRAAHLL